MKNIFKEGVVVSLSDYFVFGSTFMISLFINNFYGVDQLGYYTLIFSASQIVILSFNGSYTAIIRRDLSIDGTRKNYYTNNIFSIRIFITFFFSILSLIVTVIFIENNQIYFYFFSIMILVKGFESVNETFLTTYQTIGLIKEYSVFKVSQALFILVSIFILACLGSHIIYIYIIPLLITLIALLFHFHFLKKIDLKLKFTLDRSFFFYIRQEGWPLFISVIVAQLNVRGSVLIISRFVTANNLGIYSIGVTLISLATSFMNSLVIVLFPTLTKKFNYDPKLAYMDFKKFSMYSFFLGVVIFLLFNALFFLIPIIYKNLPDDKLFFIRLMSIAIIPIVSIGISSYMFTIIGMQKQGMKLMIILMFVNLIVFTISTYFFNFLGSCIAYVITLVLTFLSFYFRINHILKKMLYEV